ncbi:MAG: Hsp20/alpha crystallin family protein [Anaeroplasma sp.]|nr:Hsp20/alpha crystallin family protein [Anaeroplasma sp.]
MYFVKKTDNRNTLLDDFNNFFKGSFLSKDMKTDIEENEKEYLVTVDVPGVDKNNISVDFDDNTLTIEINQENEKDNSDKSYIRKERSSFSMSRSYYLENGTEEGIKAKLDNGVLNIVIPKTNKPAQNKKLISIE